MRSSRLLNALVLVILLLATASMPVVSAPAAANSQAQTLDKIEPLVLEELAARDQTEFFVWMVEKADLSPAGQLQTKQEKGRFVFNALVETAERTQRGLRRYLDAQGVDYQAFYVTNKILVRGGDQALVMDLAARADVERITANHQFQLEEPFREQPSLAEVTAIEPNITFINADDVWATGVTGQNTVLADNDTGLDETHPAIARHYRGCLNPPICTSWNHNYNWWDATGTYPTDPWDGHGHGTHTTGTMVGDDGGANQIGVAPGAQTVHCKNMTDGGSGTDATFTECFQWDLAPWDLSGANPNPDLAPDAVNNSWGYTGGGDNQFRDEVQALHAAGILVEVSAGNEGPWCGLLRSPGDYWEVLTTGSVNHAAAYPGTLTRFSSRGPSSLDPGYYFPDIMAPGENIRSSLPDNSYGLKSGTSMAGPHATALVGLIWSACPNLAGQVETTIQIIQDTAAPLTGQGGSNCGGDYIDGPNNDWGFGTIDALAAVQACGDLPPSVSIFDPTEGQPVSGSYRVLVSASDDNALNLVELSIDGGDYVDITANWDGAHYYYNWDTTTYPEGGHTLQARATDDANQTTDSEIVNVIVDNVYETMHVGDLDGSSAIVRNKWDATVTVTVHDSDEGSVANATVSGAWSGGIVGTGACTTDGSGQCEVVRTGISKKLASVIFTVENVTHSSLDYDPATNHDPDGDSDGTAITVYQQQPSNLPPVASFTYNCPDLNCSFDASASSDPDGTITTYAWDFGDGGTANEVTANHTYASAGTYTVILTVTDNEDATDTDTQYVTPGASPGTMYVFAIDMSGKQAGINLSATAVVTIRDTGGNPVVGATVDGTWSGDYSGSASGVTGIDGTVTFNSGKVRQASATFTFTVDDVVLGGWTYDPGLNIETSDTIPVP
jgi:PKD repeat protein